MKTTSAGPEGVLHLGEAYIVGKDLPENDARSLVDGGYAEFTDLPTPKAFAPGKETATVKPSETAAKGKPLGEPVKAPVEPPNWDKK